jgi:hypothetical protein
VVEQEGLVDALAALPARVDDRPVRSLEVKVLPLFLTLPARILVLLNFLTSCHKSLLSAMNGIAEDHVRLGLSPVSSEQLLWDALSLVCDEEFLLWTFVGHEGRVEEGVILDELQGQALQDLAVELSA